MSAPATHVADLPQPERIAEDISMFLASKTGKGVIKALRVQYTTYHHQAEDASLTFERKAMLIERAAGLKWAIDYLEERDRNFTLGYYDKKKENG